VTVAALIETAAFLVGLLFGSFLNVCIVRLPRNESIVSPRSRCVACGRQLRWYDNIPILSYALLRGRCRDCGARISVQYPPVEFATGLWFVLSFWPVASTQGPTVDALFSLLLHAIANCVLGFLLLGLLVIDWRHLVLPDELTLSGVFLGVLFACAEAIFLAPGEDDVVLQHAPNINSANAGRSTGNVFLTGPEHLVFGHVFAAIGAFLLLYAIRVVYRTVRKRDGMGLGDAKLLAMIAAFLGFAPGVLALFVGVLLATIYGVAQLVRGRAHGATKLPFGSFLAAGGLLAAAVGQRVVDAYLSLFPS
jgi:leader peptidase (prepilin peptidase) / N-methyltransferase